MYLYTFLLNIYSFSFMPNQLSKAGEYTYSAIEVTQIKGTDNAKNATAAGEYYVVVEKVVVYQTFAKGAVVKHEITVNRPITLTVK